MAAGYRLEVTFADGTVHTVDLETKMGGTVGPALGSLRQVGLFAQATVDQETRTVVWPNGVDLAPDALHDGAFDSITAA